MNSERPPPSSDRVEDKEHERRRLERILPELIKRIVEAGYEKISEGPENIRHFISEMKLPKEALTLIFAQLDETKNGLYRVVAREIRDFLEHTNIAEETAKVLTTLSFEVKTEVRFIPNDSRLGVPRPDVRSRVRVKKDKADRDEKKEAGAGNARARRRCRRARPRACAAPLRAPAPTSLPTATAVPAFRRSQFSAGPRRREPRGERQLKPLTAGSEIDAWCTSCRMDLGHRIVAMVEGRPKRVECLTCGGQHNYRAPKAESDKGTDGKASAQERPPLRDRRSAPAPNRTA